MAEFLLNRSKRNRGSGQHAARRIVALFEGDQRKIDTLGRPAASAHRVFQHMQRHPIVSIPVAAQKIGISAPTVAKSLEHMRQLGILSETTGRERHRLIRLRGLLENLKRGD